MQKITIIGNLGRKPEERVTQQGRKVVIFSVAVRVSKEKTQWYDVGIWEEKLSGFSGILQYLDKGSRICIIGDLGIPETYQSKEGEIKVRMRISPDSLNFVGSAQKSESHSVSHHDTQYSSSNSQGQMHFVSGRVGRGEVPL